MQRNQALLSDLLDVVTSIPTQWSGVGKNPKGTKKSLPQRGRQEFLLSLVFLTAPEGALNIKLVKCSSFFFFLFFSEYNFFTLVYLCCTINCISYESESVIHSVVSNSLLPHGLEPIRLLFPWNSPGENTRVGSLSLLQRIFPTQGLIPGLLHFMQILYCLSHEGSPNQLYVCMCVCIYICTYIYLPPSQTSLPPPPSQPSRSSQSTELSSLCYTASSH